MISISDRGDCFVLFDGAEALASCKYRENRLFACEKTGEPPAELLTALYRAVLSKMEKKGYEQALCHSPDPLLSAMGFEDGSLSLIGFFKPCGEKGD